MYQERRLEKMRLRIARERIVFSSLLVILAAALYFSLVSHRPCGIKVKGKLIAILRNKTVAQKLLQTVKAEKSMGLEEKVQFKESYQLVRLRVPEEKIDSVRDAKDKLMTALTLMIKGEVISVNGKPAVALPNRRMAEATLDEIKAKYAQGTGQLISEVEIKEKIEIASAWIEADKFKPDIESAVRTLTGGVPKESFYTVQPGDTAWGIAAKHEISLSTLRDLNPTVNLDQIYPKMKLRVKKSKSLITVTTKRRTSAIIHIPFKTEVRSAPRLYKNQFKVLQQGKFGKKKIEAIVTFENNLPVKKEIIKQEVLAKPKVKIVLRGIRPLPQRLRYPRLYASRGGERMARYIYYLYRRGNSRGAFKGVYGMRELGVDVGTAHSLNHAFGVHYANGLSWEQIYQYLKRGDHSFGGRWSCAGGPHNPQKAATWIKNRLLR